MSTQASVHTLRHHIVQEVVDALALGTLSQVELTLMTDTELAQKEAHAQTTWHSLRCEMMRRGIYRRQTPEPMVEDARAAGKYKLLPTAIPQDVLQDMVERILMEMAHEREVTLNGGRRPPKPSAE